MEHWRLQNVQSISPTHPLTPYLFIGPQTISRKQASAEELAMDYVGPAEEFVKLLRWGRGPRLITWCPSFNGFGRLVGPAQEFVKLLRWAFLLPALSSAMQRCCRQPSSIVPSSLFCLDVVLPSDTSQVSLSASAAARSPTGARWC